MELRHLRYFFAAVEEENFGRAADRLHVTRPAVPQLIADLETEIDTLLFERQAGRVQLTAAGRTLLLPAEWSAPKRRQKDVQARWTKKHGKATSATSSRPA